MPASPNCARRSHACSRSAARLRGTPHPGHDLRMLHGETSIPTFPEHALKGAAILEPRRSAGRSKDLHDERFAPRHRPRPVGGAPAHAALRRGDRRGEIRRSRHGRRGPGAELRARHRADGTDRHQSGGGARRRPADRRDAQAARHQVAFRGRAARHRRGDHRDRRNGAGRLHQQADRRLHQRGRRQGGRALRQGRQHGGRPQGHAPRGRRRFKHREDR